MRGCLCWAQILQINEHRMLVTTTLLIVMTTSLGGGFLLPMIIPRLGLKSIKQDLRVTETQSQSQSHSHSQKREPLLKRSYKSHSRNMGSTSHARTERGRRRFSVYCFNNHAEAEDDLYASVSNSPRYTSADEKGQEMPQSALNSRHLDERISTPDTSDGECFDGPSHNTQPLLSTKSIFENNISSENYCGKTKKNPESKGPGSRTNLLLTNGPHRGVSADQPDRCAVSKKSADCRAGKSKVHGGPGSVSALSKTVREHLESRYLSKPHAGSSACELEREMGRKRDRETERAAREDEELWDENDREDRGDYSVDGSDIGYLNALNDEMSSGDQVRAMASHQVVLDSIYDTGTATSIETSASPGVETVSPSRARFDLSSVSKDTAYVHDKPNASKRDHIYAESDGLTDRERVGTSIGTDTSTSNESGPPSGSTGAPVLAASYSTSSWGDIYRYKKPESSTSSKFLPRSVDRLEPLFEGRGQRGQSKREKGVPHIPFRAFELQLPDHLEGVGAKGGVSTSAQKIYKTASTFVDWVNFDEEYLKPLFGGSRREYTSIPEELLTPTR